VRGDGAFREARRKRLVAYVVLDKDQTLKLGELRDFLRAKLPDYMVPRRGSLGGHAVTPTVKSTSRFAQTQRRAA
jgi:hypothetical protein